MCFVVLCVVGPSVGFNAGVELCDGASPEGLQGVNMYVVDCMQPVGVLEHQDGVVPCVCFSLTTCFVIRNE